ncbi:MAG: double zinc ribbon domain-containing protein [Pyrinomonadaceae bacterium]
MLNGIRDALLAVAYPQACHICQNLVEKASDGIACSDCWTSAVMIADGELCFKCGLPIDGHHHRGPVSCGMCTNHKYDIARSAGVYEGAIAASILNLKRFPYISRTAGEIFTATYDRLSIDGISLIIPVPLSQKRRLERGFNQADILARLLGDHSGISINRTALARVIDTPLHRVAMDRKAREVSVQNAFKVLQPRSVEKQSILLVDDVFTSGATASNCGLALRKAGAASINVLTLARALR